jgi:hypothetical protein
MKLLRSVLVHFTGIVLDALRAISSVSSIAFIIAGTIDRREVLSTVLKLQLVRLDNGTLGLVLIIIDKLGLGDGVY